MTRVVRVLIMAWILLLCSTAVAAAAGFHWRKNVAQGRVNETGTGIGKTCSKSRFSDWKWHATLRLTKPTTTSWKGKKIFWPKGTTFVYDWIEPIRNDGTAHNLRYTHIGGTFLKPVPKRDRAQLVSALKRRLNKNAVTYKVKNGREYLDYNFSGLMFELRFAWKPGC